MLRLALLTVAGISVLGCAEIEPMDSQPKAIELIEDLRIGGLDGAVEYTFGSVSAVAPAPDGSIYVADRQGPVVRRYEADGNHVADVGRPGQGPGEYMAVDGLGVADDGTLMLYDQANGRLSRFSRDGEFTGSISVPNAFGGEDSFVYSRDGSAFVLAFPETGPIESREGLFADWARVEPDGSLDRIIRVPLAEPEGPRYVVSGRGGPYRPFNTLTLSALGPDGALFSVRNHEYRIRRERPDGSVFEISRNEEPIRATRDEIRQFEAFSEASARPPGRDRADYFPIPETKPFIRELVVDLEGRLWVSRYTDPVFMEYSEWERQDREEKGRPPFQWRDALRWDVFDADGQLIGVVTFPFKTTFVTAMGTTAWGVQGGDFEEDYIVRWRLRDPLE